jgi:hypothetical protein
MTFTRRDLVATSLAAAAVAIYAAYVVLDGVPLARDVTGMAGIGLILGFASRRVGGRAEFDHERLAFAGALGSMALGIVAMITESEVVLALFFASIAGLWLAAMYAHAHAHAGHRPDRVHAAR